MIQFPVRVPPVSGETLGGSTLAQNPQQLISHAARLLDLKGDAVGAERALRTAIAAAEQERDAVSGIQAKAFLAEVLVQENRLAEAMPLFEEIMQGVRDGGIDHDLVEPELRTAREYLAKAAGLE